MGTVSSTNTMNGGADTFTQTEGQTVETPNNRSAALQKFKLILFGQLSLGAGLLICGIMALSHFDADAFFGPPYFIGAMVAGPLLLLGGLASLMLQRHAAQYEDSDTAKQQARCDMQGIQITTTFTFMGCFMGFIMLGISGALSKNRDCFSCTEDLHKELNRRLAIAICVLLVAAFLFSIFIMYIFCTTAASFGVIMNNRRAVLFRQQHLLATQMMLNQQMLQQQQMGGVGTGGVFTSSSTTPTAPYPPTGYPMGTAPFGNAGAPNAQAMSDLQRQNEVLQQQIFIMQQQQQQQQQSGFSQAPPPPSYETVAGFK